MEPDLSLCEICFRAVVTQNDVCDRCDKLRCEVEYEEERDACEEED
jgi:hypothetical protein